MGPGLPDFYWSKHTKQEKYTKLPQTKPKGSKFYQMTGKYSKWSYNITTFSIQRPSEFYPNLFEKNIWQPGKRAQTD
jgi:hypothetical protein